MLPIFILLKGILVFDIINMDTEVRIDIFDRLKDVVPQTLLFRGKIGVGKLATAKAVASSHTQEIYIDIFCGSIGVDEIRVISKGCLIHTFEEVSRFILIETDGLSEAASNALLKVLEAPPKKVHFILIQSYKPVLSTIKSRCRVVDFVTYGNLQLRQILVDRGMSLEEARRVVQKAGGSLVKAKEVIEYAAERNTFLDGLRYLSEGKVSLFVKKIKKPTVYQTSLLREWVFELYAFKVLGVEGMEFGKHFFGYEKLPEMVIAKLKGMFLVDIKPSLAFLLLSQVLVKR